MHCYIKASFLIYGFFVLLVGPLPAQPPTPPQRAVTDPGVITTRQAITPAGAQAVFQGRVYGVTFGKDASQLFVLESKGITQLDWKANRVISQVPLRGKMGLQGIAYDAGRERAVAAYADSKTKRVRLMSTPAAAAAMSGIELGDHIAGALALHPSIIVVPLIFNNELAIVDAAGGQLKGKVKTGIAPFGAAVNRQGTVAWVTNWGGRTPRPEDLTAPTGLRADADRVVVDERGIAATGTVTRIDLEKMAATHAVPVGLHPTAMAWDEAGKRLYVANSNQDSIAVIDSDQNRLVRQIEIQPFPQKAAGIAPTALALSADGTRLYVACGGINAVAVVSTAEPRILGLIPTAWYPNGLALSADGGYLAVATLLGAGSGWQDEPGRRYVHANRGSVSVLPVPGRDQLAGYTTAVAENNHMTLAAPVRVPATQPVAIPARSGDPSLIEHVVYIIKENRTYDQVFGDLPKGNGDPKLTMFGEEVTPNQHRLADDFVLLDNFYATGGNSGDGHQWVTQANETSYCLWPGYEGRSYPYDGSDPIAYAAGGFLWDAALARKKTVSIFGEYAGRLAEPAARRHELLAAWRRGEDFTARWNITAPIAPLNRILVRNFPSYTTAIPDVVRASIFLAELKKWLAAGSMPHLTLIQLPSNHTNGTAPGNSTPRAMVADNDYALGQIVDALTHTPFWRKMAILVVEDDAQNGVDHVDGHRTVALAISPYVRRGHIDSTFYSHQSMVKTIELILGLPTLSLFDLIANDMRNSFQDAPDMAPFQVIEPRISLMDRNPELKALQGPARKAAEDSGKMRWEVPDAVPTERLNRILWGAIRGWNTPYPAPGRAAFAPLAVPSEEEEEEEFRGREAPKGKKTGK